MRKRLKISTQGLWRGEMSLVDTRWMFGGLRLGTHYQVARSLQSAVKLMGFYCSFAGIQQDFEALDYNFFLPKNR